MTATTMLDKYGEWAPANMRPLKISANSVASPDTKVRGLQRTSLERKR